VSATDPQRTCANTSTASDLRALLGMPFERVPREFLITPARAHFSPVSIQFLIENRIREIVALLLPNAIVITCVLSPEGPGCEALAFGLV